MCRQAENLPALNMLTSQIRNMTALENQCEMMTKSENYNNILALTLFGVDGYTLKVEVVEVLMFFLIGQDCQGGVGQQGGGGDHIALLD